MNIHFLLRAAVVIALTVPVLHAAEITFGKQTLTTEEGLGAGDVNDDGRVDILDKDGWFEQPTDTKRDQNWTFHPAPFVPPGFGRGGSFMFVYDVNADGRNDVVTSYEAQVTTKDINKDGKPDIVVANKKGVFVFRQR